VLWCLEECTSSPPPLFTVSELVKVHAEVMWWNNMCHPSPRSHIIFTSLMGLYHEKGCYQNRQSLLDRYLPCLPVIGQISTNSVTDTLSWGHHFKTRWSTFLRNIGTLSHCIVWKPKGQSFSWRKLKLLMRTWEKLFLWAMGIWK
jgi:hypothetical protein